MYGSRMSKSLHYTAVTSNIGKRLIALRGRHHPHSKLHNNYVQPSNNQHWGSRATEIIQVNGERVEDRTPLWWIPLATEKEGESECKFRRTCNLWPCATIAESDSILEKFSPWKFSEKIMGSVIKSLTAWHPWNNQVPASLDLRLHSWPTQYKEG